MYFWLSELLFLISMTSLHLPLSKTSLLLVDTTALLGFGRKCRSITGRASLPEPSSFPEKESLELILLWLPDSTLLKTLGAYENLSSSLNENLPHVLRDCSLLLQSVSQWDSRCGFATFGEITIVFSSLWVNGTMDCVHLLWEVTVIFVLISQEGWQLGTTEDVSVRWQSGSRSVEAG